MSKKKQIFILLIPITFCICTKNKTDSYHKDIETIPINFQEKAIGTICTANYKPTVDSLILFSRSYIDSSIKANLFYSTIKVFNKDSTLLYTYDKSDTNNYEIIQNIALHHFTYDTFFVRMWSYLTIISDDCNSNYKFKKLYIGTSNIYNQSFPIHLEGDKNE